MLAVSTETDERVQLIRKIAEFISAAAIGEIQDREPEIESQFGAAATHEIIEAVINAGIAGCAKAVDTLVASVGSENPSTPSQLLNIESCPLPFAS
jgi:hypothetical protein